MVDFLYVTDVFTFVKRKNSNSEERNVVEKYQVFHGKCSSGLCYSTKSFL